MTKNEVVHVSAIVLLQILNAYYAPGNGGLSTPGKLLSCWARVMGETTKGYKVDWQAWNMPSTQDNGPCSCRSRRVSPGKENYTLRRLEGQN